MIDPRRYPATPVRAVDGDTIDLLVDLGFHVLARLRFRLKGLDAPEAGTPEGTEATAFTSAWLDANPSVEVETYKTDLYGRWLAVVWGAQGNTLNGDLVAAHHAEPKIYH